MKPHTMAPAATPEAVSGTPARLRRFGVLSLMIAHCAGMIDLAALPLWISTLVGHYGLDPQRAGALPTLFLAGVVLSSMACSPLLARLPARAIVPTGFAIAAAAFFVARTTSLYPALAALHALAGLAVGASLSLAHGIIGRSERPHRVFALAGMSLGLVSIAFLGVSPSLIQAHGGGTFFTILCAVMSVAAVVSALGLPFTAASASSAATADGHGAARGAGPRLAAHVWFGIGGVCAMALTQAMLISFVVHIGTVRGFGETAITAVLVTLGMINLVPAPAAALLERRLNARAVLCIGPIVQAGLGVLITADAGFAAWAAASAMLSAVMIFCHTFAFGMLARLDPTGRAVAATPAMVMTGAAIGPLLGGTLVKFVSLASLGYAGMLFGAIALMCFSRIPHRYGQPEAPK
ncbi:MFS transporter [Pandoraea sp. CB10b_02]|uniref:MFS transporter n=1 Tax=Pandoraea sp. CB10b_02 TaxID=2014535 RepID=UPI00257F2A75|nr:MFS transporter [Pandoraea sp. CB10b_02]